MKIVVTGAAGLVGLNLLTLLDKKHSITAIDKDKQRLAIIETLHPEVTVLCADVTKSGSWEKSFARADAVIQLQAQISAPGKEPYVANNITSVKQVLRACRVHRVKHLIHLSSSVVISKSNDFYVQTKTTGEQLVRTGKVPYTILRPPLMYGCFDYKHLGYITKLIEKIPLVPIPGSGKYMRQPLYVLDLCRIIVSLTKRKPTNQAYNIIGKEEITFINLLRMIAKEKKLHRLFVPLPVHVFGFLLQTYTILTRKAPFVKGQMYALTAGDVFPVENWEKTFGVKYTPFRQAQKQMLASAHYQYRAGHSGA